MKILHIANTNHFSGAENVICQIISMFKDEPQVEMAYVSPEGSIREALLERDIRFIPITQMTIKELGKVFKEEKPDVVHAHDMKASLVASLACKGIKFISHLHNNDFANRYLSMKSLGYLIPAMKASHIFYVSKSAYNGYLFHRLFEKKSSVLYNVIDIDALKKKAGLDPCQYKYDAIYLGRLTYQKDPLRLLKVFRLITDALPAFKASIVGTGEMEQEVVNEWKRLKLQDNVELLGFVSNPLKLLQDAKFMLMTSRWEGTPMCSLEALALGTPIVTTPTDGLSDIIEEGKTGFLSNVDKELAEKAILLIRNEEVRNMMREACVNAARRLNDIDKYKTAISKEYLSN